MFFDFHVHGDHEMVEEAGRLGYNGVVLVQNSHDIQGHSDILKQSNDESLPQIMLGVEIMAKNPHYLKKKVQKFRKKFDVILVHGGDDNINRTAVEDSRVDILAHPYLGRWDCGINHVLATKAAENRVAVEINLKYFLKTRSNYRHKVLSQFREIMKLQRKYLFPIIINSAAGSVYDLRRPEDIISLAQCFGMTSQEAEKSLSQTALEIMERSSVRDHVVVVGVRKIS